MNRLAAMLCAIAVLLSFSTIGGAEGLINGAGASFPYPVYSAWSFEYAKATGIKVNYQSIGSGGGQKQIEARTVDFGASDDPLPIDKLESLKVIQFPAIIGGVVPVVNLPGVNSGDLKLDGDTLCKLFRGDIKKWSDDKVKALNPGLKLPELEVNVVHRSDGSGTTAIFTHYLAEVCPAWKEKPGEGKAVDWPVGIGGKGNEGVANYVKRMAGAIGYVEFAYAKQNKLASTKLKNAAGEFVEPTMQTFQDAAASGDFIPAKGFFTWLTNTSGKTSWPISGASFILLAKDKNDAGKKVVTFFDWSFKNGDATAEKLIYVPLPRTLKDKVINYWKENKLL